MILLCYVVGFANFVRKSFIITQNIKTIYSDCGSNSGHGKQSNFGKNGASKHALIFVNRVQKDYGANCVRITC